MFRVAFQPKYVGLCPPSLPKLLFSSMQPKLNMYKPKVRDTKSRNSSKPRKVNLSKKLRMEFAKQKGKTPIIKCKRMEFNFYEGMEYGKFETIPLASSGWTKRGSNGDYFTLFENYMVPNDMHFGHVRLPKTEHQNFLISDKKTDSPTFSLLGIEDHFVEVLKKMHITRPADIQTAAIPYILQGKNSVVSAHTGCGKTLAFLLPIVQMVLEGIQEEGGVNIPHDSPRVLILTPSRELTYQIFDVLQKLVSGSSLTAKLFVGGYDDSASGKDISLPEVVDIAVGSLGTVMKHLRKGSISLQRLQHLVLDEADQLVDDQNRPMIRKILKQIPIKKELDDEDNPYQLIPGAQLTLVSATIPLNLASLFENMLDVDSLERVCTSYLHDVLRNVPQLFLKVGKTNKGKALIDLVEKDHKQKRPVIIFSNKMQTADWVCQQLNESGFACKNLTSSVDTGIRQHLFKQFQEGQFDILSTTPMVARGLDTVRAKHIINYEFPLYVSEYIHQIGRVGRIGSSKSCHITNIISHQREVALVQKIELSVRKYEKLHAVNANIQGILRNRSEQAENDIF